MRRPIPVSQPSLGPEEMRCVQEAISAGAISGTHGKTSTTSLLTVGAQACGVDPSFAIGGNLYETGKNAHLGTGELAIVEADESDGSFLLARPAAAVVTPLAVPTSLAFGAEDIAFQNEIEMSLLGTR